MSKDESAAVPMPSRGGGIIFILILSVDDRREVEISNYVY